MRARSMSAIIAIAAIAGGCDESAFTRARAAATESAATASAASADAGAPPTSASAELPPWRAGGCGGSSTMACMTAAFRRCYNASRSVDPHMHGTLRIRAQIGPEGEVTSAKAEQVTGRLSPEVVACVEKRVRLAHFSPPEGGSTTIIIPVTFVTDDEPSDAGTERRDK